MPINSTDRHTDISLCLSVETECGSIVWKRLYFTKKIENLIAIGLDEELLIKSEYQELVIVYLRDYDYISIMSA